MTLKPTTQTVAYGVSPLVKDGFGNVCSNKIQKRIDEVTQNLVSEFGQSAYEQTKAKIQAEFQKQGYDKMDVISGKDYIFPLLKVRARATVKTNMTDLNFKMRLVCKVGLDAISDCDNYIAKPAA